MTSNDAPPPDAERAGRARSVLPAAEGVAPAPSTAQQVDWSGTRQAAAVGRLVEAAGRFDRLAADLVETLIRAIEDDACETKTARAFAHTGDRDRSGGKDPPTPRGP